MRGLVTTAVVLTVAGCQPGPGAEGPEERGGWPPGTEGTAGRAVGTEASPCAPGGAEYEALPLQLELGDLGLWVTPNRFDLQVGGGLVIADLDGDDRADLLFPGAFGDGALLSNRGGRAFEPWTDSGLPLGEEGFGAAAVDLDGDGDRDVLWLAHGIVRRFEQDGGRFDEVEPLVIFEEPTARPVGLTWADYDADGHVDAHLVVHSAEGDPLLGERSPSDRLFGGLGGGEFEDRTAELGLAEDRTGFGFASTWHDFDGDGRLDLLVGNDFGQYVVPNRLFLQEDGGFVQAAEEYALDLAIGAMGVALADVQGDGRTEVVVSDTDDLWVLSESDGPWLETGRSDGLEPDWHFALAAWAVWLDDLDHDRDLDLLVARGWKEPGWPTPVEALLYRWDDGWRRDEGFSGAPGDNWLGRSLAGFDLDGDGTLEIVQSSMAGTVGARGRGCAPGHWLEIELRGAAGNPDGAGALVELLDAGLWRRVVPGGQGIGTYVQGTVHFGLGEAAESQRVRVSWPDGVVSEVLVEADRRWAVLHPEHP